MEAGYSRGEKPSEYQKAGSRRGIVGGSAPSQVYQKTTDKTGYETKIFYCIFIDGSPFYGLPHSIKPIRDKSVRDRERLAARRSHHIPGVLHIE